ncbi:hypothetical protein HUJ04_000373 [Dendroctonus ponderosae]|nr:hypothetical protein HUJ04_000373 [Dendroctonus ponderosae]
MTHPYIFSISAVKVTLPPMQRDDLRCPISTSSIFLTPSFCTQTNPKKCTCVPDICTDTSWSASPHNRCDSTPSDTHRFMFLRSRDILWRKLS